MEPQQASFEGWAIVEMMRHRSMHVRRHREDKPATVHFRSVDSDDEGAFPIYRHPKAGNRTMRTTNYNSLNKMPQGHR